MPSGDLSHRLFLTQRFFHNLIALLRVPPTRFGHLCPPGRSPRLSMAILLSLIPCSESRGTRHAQAEQFVGDSVATELEKSGFIVRLYKQ